MAAKLPKRGFVWIAVGAALLIAGFFMERPLVLRGTSLPFWPFIMGLGVIMVLGDLYKTRKSRGDSADPPA